MNIEAIKDIINLIKSEEKYNLDVLIGEEPQFSDKRYSPITLNKNNVNEFPIFSGGNKITYIDGGNIHLFSSPSLYLGLVRIYFNIFENNKIILPKKIPQKYEFYVFRFYLPGKKKILLFNSNFSLFLRIIKLILKKQTKLLTPMIQLSLIKILGLN